MATDYLGNIAQTERVLQTLVQYLGPSAGQSDIDASSPAAGRFLAINPTNNGLIWQAGTGAGANSLGELSDVANAILKTAGLFMIGQGTEYDGKALSGDVSSVTAAGLLTIANNAITTAKIIDNAVNSQKILDGAVTSGKIGIEAIVASHLNQALQQQFISIGTPVITNVGGGIVDLDYPQNDLNGGVLTTDQLTAVEVRVSESASNCDPSDDCIIGNTPSLTNVVGGSGTATAIVRDDGSGRVKFRLTGTVVAVNRFLYFRNSWGSAKLVRQSLGVSTIPIPA